MDNFNLDISYEGDENLKTAIKLAMKDGYKIYSYKLVRVKREVKYFGSQCSPHTPENCHGISNLSVFHTEEEKEDKDGHLTLRLFTYGGSLGKDQVQLLYPLDVEGVYNFVKGWLENGAELGKEPDHDGDNKAGWRVFNYYGSGAKFAVQGIWAQYGK